MFKGEEGCQPVLEEDCETRGASMEKINRYKAFGRKAVKLSESQKALIEEVLPHVKIPLGGGTFNPSEYFEEMGPLHLEIGFGGGEYTSALALACPEHRIVACEIFLNGIASLLKNMETRGQQNIRIIHGNAILAVETMFSPGTFDFIHINHPDPWPKKRHMKRRLVQPRRVENFAGILKPGGEVWLSTDACEYYEWMMECFDGSDAFEAIPAEGRYLDYIKAEKVVTRFENKGRIKGRDTNFLRYRKRV